MLVGCVGLAFGALFPSYYVTGYYVNAGILLPAHSPRRASDLTLMTRDDHPGVRVVAYGGRHIGFSATGSLGSTERAVNLAVREVVAANDGKVKRTWDGLVFRLPPRHYGLSPYGLTGLLAGLGTALAFIVPPKAARDRRALIRGERVALCQARRPVLPR